MSTKTEDLSALSYVNKDFGAIYPEMLDLAKQLTNKWDPSKSNESDPGVVLLKEGAFVADHNNYNIDKNILEAFLPSATQDRSVRNITEMNGYTPRYYVSANGDVTFKWKMPDEESNLPKVYTIPAFTLVISDADESVSYTQVENLSVGDSQTSCMFIEGTLQTLTINDLSVINIDNLDDNNRIYLPESMVAQNGVFIKNINREDYEDYWVRDNYLITKPVGSRVFKVDYDSYKELPYIEFPSDIANLIGDGLQIQYIATSGIAGNVSANSLCKILSPSSFTDIDGNTRSTSSFSLWNSAAIVNGKNPETIDEMYQSFKRVVGTFDTLVTCQDYSNKIYSLTDDYDNPLVSNVYVTDRRTDYNKSSNVITYDIDTLSVKLKNISTNKCSLVYKGLKSTYDELINVPNSDPGDMYCVTAQDATGGLYVNMSSQPGISKFVKQDSINLNDFSLLTAAMTPYDLVIYGLKAFAISEYNSNKLYFQNALNNSFKPISSLIRTEIESDIEGVKCISHKYNNPTSGDIYCFKNYAPLDIRIETFNKIEKEEEDQILNNIYIAISQNFNPRFLDFGEKLDESKLRNVIIDSDSRIKNIDISPIIYRTIAMTGDADGIEHDLNDTSIYSGTTILLDLVAKNILAGRVCLFEFDNKFNYEYGQEFGKIHDIAENRTIKTELYIPLTPTEENTEIALEKQTRDFIKIIQIGDGTSAPAYKYTLEREGGQGSIANNNSIELGVGEVFTLYELQGTTDKIIKTTAYSSTSNVTISIVNNTSAPINATTTKTNLQSGSISIITSEEIATTKPGTVNLDYTLNENEIIQIIHPNYYSDKTFGMYVNYRYEGNNTDRIYANTEHTLTVDERVILIYSKDGVESSPIVYKTGDIINASFDLVPTDLLSDLPSSNRTYIYNNETFNKAFRMLSSNQTISSRKLLSTKLDDSGIWCYWIINSASDGTNTLFENDDTYRILRNNEYFIYTNADLNELVILGAGTRISRTSTNSSSKWRIDNKDNITIESISENGTSSDISWQKNLDLSRDNLYITEMNIITLGKGDNIKILGWTNDLMPKYDDGDEEIPAFCGDDYSTCDGTIMYTINNETVTLPSADNFYMIKSRLDLNMSSIPQQLFATYDGEGETYKSIQRIILNDSTVISAVGDYNNRYVQSSRPLVAVGNTINIEEPVKLYEYSLKDGYTYKKSILVGDSKNVGTSSNPKKFSYMFSALEPSNYTYIIPVHIIGDDVDIYVDGSYYINDPSSITNVNIYDYNNNSIAKGNILTLSGNNSYYIAFDFETSSSVTAQLDVWFNSLSTKNEIIYIDNVCIIEGLNNNLKNLGNNDDQTLRNLLDRINAIIAGSDKPSIKMYYPYKINNSIAMDITDFKDPYIMWDKNNIANMMTIPQVDLENSTISVYTRLIK